MSPSITAWERLWKPVKHARRLFLADPAPDAPQPHGIASDKASDTGPAYAPPPRRLVIEQYRRDDDVDPGELSARRIDELLRRSQ